MGMAKVRLGTEVRVKTIRKPLRFIQKVSHCGIPGVPIAPVSPSTLQGAISC
jgi:hypothetical protein